MTVTIRRCWRNWIHRSRHNWIWLLPALALALSACSAPRGWVPVADPTSLNWRDDGISADLGQAIARSIGYYKRLPRTVRFRYGELTYSPVEMIASMELFLRLLRETPGETEIAARLKESFHLFESIASNEENLFTGYYEPIIQGSEKPKGALDTPLLARPESIVEVDLSLFGEDMPSRRLVGRVQDGRLQPFYTRREINEHKSIETVARPLAYVDRVDLFFLQIQGSGIVAFPDGRRIKVNYHGSNGHPYRSIGALLIRREIMDTEEVTLQSIRRYLKENPDSVLSVLYENPSYTFFRVVEEGPLGNIGVRLTAERSLALDHRLFAKGGLAYVDLRIPKGEAPGERQDPEKLRPFRRFMVVQDTGGAIRGHGRADIFWGQGSQAEAVAGRLKHPGRLWLLVAKKEAIRAYLASKSAAAGTADTAHRTQQRP